MSLRTITFIVVVTAFLLTLAGTVLYSYRKARRRSETEWEDLLASLKPVNSQNITLVALDHYSDRDSSPLRDVDVWSLVGGLDGLATLQANCEVFIEMASYVQRFYPEALPIAEELRVSARHIAWHVSRLQAASHTGTKIDSALARYAQQVAATYYGMTQSLLGLFEWTKMPETASLQAAL